MQSTIDHPSIFSGESRHEIRTDYDPVLFGADPTERIVAVEPSDGSVFIWQRGADDLITKSSVQFHPWLLLASPNSTLAAEPTELEGSGFRYLYELETWSAFQAAQSHVRDNHIECLVYA